MVESAVAVTGAAGFVGRNVVRALAGRSERVIAVVRPEEEIPEAFPAEVRAIDFRSETELRSAFADASRIIHLAARSGGIQLQESTHRDLYDENRVLTDSVISMAASAGVDRLFIASSAVVYRTSANATISEGDALIGPADGPTGYAWSKLTDEVAAAWANRTGGIQTVVGRFGNIYGPEASFDPARSTVIHGLISRIVNAPADGTVIVWGDGHAVRSFIHVEDVAQAILGIVDRGEPGTAYNVDTSEAIEIRDLAVLIRDLASPRVSLEFDPMKPSGPPRRVPDSARLRSLGFRPTVSLVDGLAATINWYKENVVGH